MSISNFHSTPQTIDNEKWVADNIQHLDRKDVNATFRYVRFHHPSSGMAFSFASLPNIKVDNSDISSLLSLSKYADAVTVCCYEELGNRQGELARTGLENLTGIANVAYIAQRHPNDAVREKFTRALLNP
jgi:hypothetical protein